MPYNPKGTLYENHSNKRSSNALLGSRYNPKGGLYENHAKRSSSTNLPPHSEPPGFVEKNLDALKDLLITPLNIFLIFVPLGIVSGLKEWNPLYTFLFNFMAIVPLAGVLGGSTEALAAHTGQMIGGLLNATFGNAVEMIVTINAIKAGLITVVQDSLIGSIISNLLLVLGMAFIAGGMVSKESNFNITGAAANVTCLVLASLALTLPTVFKSIENTTLEETVGLSRICATVLILVYILFLWFQLRTHAELFVGEEEEEGEADMSAGVAVGMLFACTCCVAYCSEFLVDSIEVVSKTYGMPEAFIGFILLPIVGNAAEHTTAVTAAYKNKMDLALGVAVGSSTQIALFVIPFSVIVGWIVDVPMSLDFHKFSTTVFVLSTFIASSVLGDGNANWFEGAMLVSSYIIVGIIVWYIPSEPEHSHRELMSYSPLHHVNSIPTVFV